jgi:hypothetical protein
MVRLNVLVLLLILVYAKQSFVYELIFNLSPLDSCTKLLLTNS